uniref:Glutamate receptor n=2 Tax=Clastoptera arizonana TaxID=38151 RepID=A0A1B6CLB4_9HEMI
MFLTGVYVLSLFTFVVTLPSELRIGGLFESIHGFHGAAFNVTAEIINEDQSFMKDVRLEAQIETVPPYDSFVVAEKVCELVSTGVVGIFGPQSSDTTDHVQSMCDTMEIPHLAYRWDSRQRRGSCLVNLFPYPPVLAKVYADIVGEFQWKTFTLLYADDEGLLRLNELLKLFTMKPYHVTVRQLDEGLDYRETFLKMKKNGEKNIVLDCPAYILYDVLMHAQQVGVMGDDVSYIITTLDFTTIDLEPFRYSGTNITGLRMVDPENESVGKFVEVWNKHVAENGDEELEEITAENISVEQALLHDAVQLFTRSLYYLDNSTEIQSKILSCEKQSNWEHGYSLINYMKMSEITGMTGVIKFDHEGFRSNFMLDLIELTFNGLRKKGSWNSSEGLNLTLAAGEDTPQVEVMSLQNKTFIVMIALTHPYGMLKENKNSLVGNDRFEGLGIDIIHELSLINGFNYTFKVQEDKSSGNPNPKTGKWSGMLGEVLDDRAQLAIADITITREREKDVDFTSPFMNLGISILYKKPQKTPPSLFSFLSPFSPEVWWYVIAAYIGVSLLLFVMARISPLEWTNPYPCIEEPESLENQFSLNNSFWFSLGSILQQGSEIAPIATSTRLAASVWWFFTLIMVSSYTANLAAFLTVEGKSVAFKSIEDLANQNPPVIKFGAKKGGSTANFFRDSNSSTYQKIWQYMHENMDEVMTSSNEDGVNRVLNDKYAFFMESTSIEYEVERKCDLTQVGSLLDNKGYGIAMNKNAPYRHALSASILRLQEKGKITQLKNKWWKEKRGGGACLDDGGEGGSADELGLDNTGGVFLVLVGGSALACVVTVVEIIIDISNKKDKVFFYYKTLASFV